MRAVNGGVYLHLGDQPPTDFEPGTYIAFLARNRVYRVESDGVLWRGGAIVDYPESEQWSEAANLTVGLEEDRHLAGLIRPAGIEAWSVLRWEMMVFIRRGLVLTRVIHALSELRGLKTIRVSNAGPSDTRVGATACARLGLRWVPVDDQEESCSSRFGVPLTFLDLSIQRARAAVRLRSRLGLFRSNVTSVQARPQRSAGSRRPVLFLAYTGRCVRHCLPIRDALATDGVPSVLVVIGEQAEAAARSHHWPFVHAEATLDEASYQCWLAARWSIASAWQLARDRFRHEIGMMDADLRSVALEALDWYAGRQPRSNWALAGQNAEQSLQLTMVARAVLRQIQPSAIVLANEYATPGAAFWTVAVRSHVPVVAIQHGSQYAAYPWKNFQFYDAIAVWGAYTARLLAKAGVDSHRIVVTGSACHEHTYGMPERKHRSNAAPVILLAPTATGVVPEGSGIPTQVAELLAGLAERVPDVHVLVKLHPDEVSGHWDPVLKALGPNARLVDSDSPLESLLGKCDAVFTVLSTVAVDALAAGLPVITMRPEDELLEPEPWTLAGAVSEVGTVDELVREVTLIARGTPRPELEKARAAFLEDFLGPRDGRAAERVARLISALSSTAPLAEPRVGRAQARPAMPVGGR